jgi:hypothetical protein
VGSDAEFDRAGGVTEARKETQGHVINNVRAALNWAYSDRGDPTLAVDLTAAAAPVWIHQLLIDECRERIEQAITLITEEAVRRDARRELRLFSAVAVAYMDSTGDASKIDEAWSRVVELAEELNDSEYRIRSLWGLWLGRYLKGDHQGALQIALRFATLPDGAVEAADRFVGERILGVTLHILGDQISARVHIENMLRGYVAPPGQVHILRYHYDQHVAARAFHAQVLWLLGFPDQAMAVGKRALDDKHPCRRCCRALHKCCRHLEPRWRRLRARASSSHHALHGFPSFDDVGIASHLCSPKSSKDSAEDVDQSSPAIMIIGMESSL